MSFLQVNHVTADHHHWLENWTLCCIVFFFFSFFLNIYYLIWCYEHVTGIAIYLRDLKTTQLNCCSCFELTDSYHLSNGCRENEWINKQCVSSFFLTPVRAGESWNLFSLTRQITITSYDKVKDLDLRRGVWEGEEGDREGGPSPFCHLDRFDSVLDDAFVPCVQLASVSCSSKERTLNGGPVLSTASTQSSRPISFSLHTNSRIMASGWCRDHSINTCQQQQQQTLIAAFNHLTLNSQDYCYHYVIFNAKGWL